METLGALHHYLAYEDASVRDEQSHPLPLPHTPKEHSNDGGGDCSATAIPPSSVPGRVGWLVAALVTSTLQGPVLLRAVVDLPVLAQVQHYLQQLSAMGSPSSPVGAANVVSMEMSELMQLLYEENTSVTGSLSTDADPSSEASVTVSVADDDVDILVTNDDAVAVPVAARVTSDRTCIQCLRIGDQGSDVTGLQNRLRTLGFFTATATGYFGPITEAAVIQFQQANGLMVDGVVGPQTLGMLGREPAVATMASRPTVYYEVVDYSVPTVRVQAPTVVSSSAPPSTVIPRTVGAELYKGSTGETVRTIQTQLQQLGFYQGPVTGYYGVLTASAVENFQRAHGIPASGITGVKTLVTLRERVTQ